MNEPVPEAEDAHEREAAVLESYLRALDAGEAPNREEVLARHPDLAAELGKALDGLDLVRRAGKRLSAEESAAAREGAGVGPTLGDYRLLREIGRGGMAVVYEAEQISLGRRVALKVLPFAAVLEPKQLQRFKNEALAAAQLQHPNVVPVYGVGCERGIHYYAMQYVEGQSLDRAIRDLRAGIRSEGPTTPISSHTSNREPAYVRMMAKLGMQAAEALDHAHHLGVVHRDVKPANLLIDRTGTLWVTDFGLARCLKDAGLTLTGELLGTVRYMSPEQAHVKPLPIDHRTDVYSLGATLYEMFTLEPAFPGDDHHAVIEDIATRQPVPPRRLNPALPRDLETVLLKAMSKDPSARYATAREMAEDLGRYLSDEPVLARRPSVVSRAARWSRRHRLVVSAACGLLVLGLAALVAYGARITEEQRKTASVLHLARTVVDKYLVEADLGDFDPARYWAEGRPTRHYWVATVNEGLLETALAFYEGLEDEQALRQRVPILEALGRYDAALAVVDRLVALRPADARVTAVRGALLRKLGRHPQGLAEYERAIAMEPDSAEASRLRAGLLQEAGHLDDEIAALREAIQRNPDDGRVRCWLGDALREAGHYREAIEQLGRAVEDRPTDALSAFGLGQALMDHGEVERAIPELRRALRLRPGFAVARTHLGMALDRLGERKAAMWEHTEAIRSHQEILRMQPNDVVAHVSLGCAYGEIQDYERAAEAFREAIRLRPGTLAAHYNLAEVLASMNRFDEALASVREAIRIARSYARAWASLGWILEQAGKMKEAEESYREAIRLRPGYAYAHTGLGTVLEHIDPTRAIEALREAVRLDPNHYDARRALAGALKKRADRAGEIEQLQEAIRINSTDSDAHALLGSAYASCGRVDEAVESFREAVRLNPSNTYAVWHFGRFLLFTRRYREALPLLHKGRDLARRTRPDLLADVEGRIESAERGLELEGALDRALAGETTPKTASECIGFAEQLHAKHLPLAAASFFARAFAEEGAVSDDLVAGEHHRYNAACCAVRGAEHGDQSAGAWRERALAWLRLDLAARETRDPRLGVHLADLKRDPELASVRDRIDALPETEREGWRRLWADVDAALGRAQK